MPVSVYLFLLLSLVIFFLWVHGRMDGIVCAKIATHGNALGIFKKVLMPWSHPGIPHFSDRRWTLGTGIF